MLVNQKIFTCKAFLLCMNFSFVISMSQLHNTLFGEYVETLFSLCGLFFFVLHFISSAKIQWRTLLVISVLILVGLIAVNFSGGATLLKLVLFFAVTQKVELRDVLEGYSWSLLIPFGFIVFLSLIGVVELYYSGPKVAIEFGLQNPNTVPVIVFSIIVAFNLKNEQNISGKVIAIEMFVSLLLYFLCRARTAGIILGCYLIGIVLFKNAKSIAHIFKPTQYMFLICMGASILIATFFRSRTAIWIQINNFLSGRPWAWDLYLTKYGINFWGQEIDLTIAALDNAYLRLLIQYGLLAFLAYFFIFIKISRFAFRNKKIILFLSIIAYELYFMAEFGPILINFCPVLMYEACLLVNQNEKRRMI